MPIVREGGRGRGREKGIVNDQCFIANISNETYNPNNPMSWSKYKREREGGRSHTSMIALLLDFSCIHPQNQFSMTESTKTESLPDPREGKKEREKKQKKNERNRKNYKEKKKKNARKRGREEVPICNYV